MSEPYPIPINDSLADPRISGSVDPSALAGSRDIYDVARFGVEVADVIATEEPFNKDCAEMSMRNLAGLVNRLRIGDYLDIPEEDRTRMKTLAGDTEKFLFGDGAEAEAKTFIDKMRPKSSEEAELFLMQKAFNELQVQVSIGPGAGYNPDNEAEIRQFVRQYATVFAGALFGLSAANNRLTTQNHAMDYVISTTEAARPQSMRDQR